MSGKKGMKHDSKETKLEAVRLILEVGLTRAEVAEQLGLFEPALSPPSHVGKSMQR